MTATELSYESTIQYTDQEAQVSLALKDGLWAATCRYGGDELVGESAQGPHQAVEVLFQKAYQAAVEALEIYRRQNTIRMASDRPEAGRICPNSFMLLWRLEQHLHGNDEAIQAAFRLSAACWWARNLFAAAADRFVLL